MSDRIAATDRCVSALVRAAKAYESIPDPVHLRLALFAAYMAVVAGQSERAEEEAT